MSCGSRRRTLATDAGATTYAACRLARARAGHASSRSRNTFCVIGPNALARSTRSIARVVTFPSPSSLSRTESASTTTSSPRLKKVVPVARRGVTHRGNVSAVSINKNSPSSSHTRAARTIETCLRVISRAMCATYQQSSTQSPYETPPPSRRRASFPRPSPTTSTKNFSRFHTCPTVMASISALTTTRAASTKASASASRASTVGASRRKNSHSTRSRAANARGVDSVRDSRAKTSSGSRSNASRIPRSRSIARVGRGVAG